MNSCANLRWTVRKEWWTRLDVPIMAQPINSLFDLPVVFQLAHYVTAHNIQALTLETHSLTYKQLDTHQYTTGNMNTSDCNRFCRNYAPKRWITNMLIDRWIFDGAKNSSTIDSHCLFSTRFAKRNRAFRLYVMTDIRVGRTHIECHQYKRTTPSHMLNR